MEAGVNLSLLPVMSAMAIEAPSVTEVPLLAKVPFAGRVVILTAVSAFAVVSLGSENPKSELAKVWAVFSRVVTVLSVPAGASFTELTVMDTVSVSDKPPLSVESTVRVSAPLKLLLPWYLMVPSTVLISD